MRNIQFIIFFSIVITVFSLLSFYIYSRGVQAFPAGTSGRFWFRTVFIFLSASYIIARVLERLWLSPVSDAFTWIGSFWLGAFFYFLIIVLAIDIVRLLNQVIPAIPDYFKTPAGITILFWSAVGLVSLLLIGGHINARNPRLKTVEVQIPKKVEGMNELTIAFASDLHLGTLIGPRRTKHLVERINDMKADIILLGGDIVDEDLAPVIRNNLGNNLERLTSKYGVFGITGNHEYIGGASEAVKYLTEHGITMVRDTSLLIDNKFYIVGREDHDGQRFGSKGRKSVNEIMQGLNRNKPIILLDHQPFELDEKAREGADLTMSGHTHHGQLWPLNYITKAIFEVSWGYKLKGNTHVYVSSGAGGWGPPIRIGNRPEIVKIKMRFLP
ncbi:MAG: metallophosphoesterase [Bacteroidales bacterium]|nr:metallophosphoesterase [Bacteroidales bacterium]MCF8405424.1 metallophosphoesterase [Bacteroidales bacterium]